MRLLRLTYSSITGPGVIFASSRIEDKHFRSLKIKRNAYYFLTLLKRYFYFTGTSRALDFI